MDAGNGAETARTYKSEALAALHETMEGLHQAGGIAETTMRRFDAACLTEVRSFTADAIRALRQREGVSQAVFAHYLNVTPGLVSQWERGEKAPGSPALKLLSLIERKGIDYIA
jgi:putative transcriptional regulator